MRAAVAFGHPKALARSNSNIRAHGSRFFQQRQRQRISRDDPNTLMRMQGGHVISEIAHMPVGAGVLKDRAKDRFWVHVCRIIHDYFDAQRSGTRAHHSDVLWVAVMIHKEPDSLGF